MFKLLNMVVIDNQTNRIYECSRKDAATLMKCTTQTLYNWQRKYKTRFTRENRTVVFCSVIRIKQKRGFALNKRRLQRNN